jgi:hypothetical protein
VKHVLFALGLASVTAATSASADDFSFLPPGDLIAGSGKGRVDEKVYAPGMLFPIVGKAYANSQVYMTGGSNGPAGSQCATVNFSYPWRDNYCETRSWDMPLCPAGIGHQGQDIRAATCDKNVHWVQAVVDGTITSVGSYSVYLTAADGTRYDYLHMDSVQVTVGAKVKHGDHLGKVSNNFGGTATSVHLHFNLKQNVASLGFVFVPPYMSLVKSYQATQTQPPKGALEVADCDRLAGWAFDPEMAAAPVTVDVDADGVAATSEQTLTAAREREDLCDTLGSCNHAFSVASPLSLFDGKAHELRLFAVDPTDKKRYELLESPATLTCSAPAPKGLRRPLDADAAKAWALSSFWDGLPSETSGFDALPIGDAAPSEPKVFTDPNDPATLWVVDGNRRRKLSASDADGWHLEPSELVAAGDAVLGLDEGPAFPRRAVMISVNGETFLVDDGETASPREPSGGGTSGEGAELGGTSASASCALGTRSTATPASLLVLSAALAAAWTRRSRPRSR